MKDADTDRGVVLAELAAVNIKPFLVELSGVVIGISRGGHVRRKRHARFYVAATPGDWRSRLNTRAQVRRLLRADNVSLLEVVKKPKTAFDEAMTAPTETPSMLDEIRADTR